MNDLDEIMDEIKYDEKYGSYYEDSYLLEKVKDEKERVRKIVERFHCSNEVAKKSSIVFVQNYEENFVEIGHSCALSEPRKFIMEEYRCSSYEAADLKCRRLIKKYLELGYEVKTYNGDIYIPTGNYTEYDLEEFVKTYE